MYNLPIFRHFVLLLGRVTYRTLTMSNGDMKTHTINPAIMLEDRCTATPLKPRLFSTKPLHCGD